MCKPEDINKNIYYMDILNDAYDFYSAANYLNNNSEIIYPNIRATNGVTITVNIALACELFIKGLLNLENKDKFDTHNLYKLFCSLNGKTQQQIIRIVSNSYKYETSQEIDRKNFIDSLKVVKDYYVTHRYWFEDINNGIDYKGVGLLKKICDAIIIIANTRIEEYYNFDIFCTDENKIKFLRSTK